MHTIVLAAAPRPDVFLGIESDFGHIRRCIAVDLLAHGDTVIKPDQDVSVTANAHMLREVLDVLRIDQVDLIGNDSGGGIAQIFAYRRDNLSGLEFLVDLPHLAVDELEGWEGEASETGP